MLKQRRMTIIVKIRILKQMILSMGYIFALFSLFANTTFPVFPAMPLIFFLGLTFFTLQLAKKYRRLPFKRRRGERFIDLIFQGLFCGWLAILVYLDFVSLLLII